MSNAPGAPCLTFFVRQKMFSFPKSLLSTLIAWLSAIALMMVYSYATKPPNSWTATPVVDFMKGAAILSYFVGIVIFPTCMLVVTPLLRLLPKTSLLWRPSWSCAVGAITGPIAMYLWACGFRTRFFVPELHDSTHLFFGVCSAVAGAVFAYSYARGFARSYSSKAEPLNQ